MTPERAAAIEQAGKLQYGVVCELLRGAAEHRRGYVPVLLAWMETVSHRANDVVADDRHADAATEGVTP